MKEDKELPLAFFGSTDSAECDWRSEPDEEDSDDEELEETPPDVIEMLGFDPLEGE